jgi:hypothetical protein
MMVSCLRTILLLSCQVVCSGGPSHYMTSDHMAACLFSMLHHLTFRIFDRTDKTNVRVRCPLH